MSLLKPTPGEVIDRLSIVELKIEACQRAGLETNRLTQEFFKLRSFIWKHHTAIVPQVLFRDRDESSTIFDLSEQLSNTNSELWKAEDDVRIPSATMLQIASSAQLITKLNDRRCNLIRQIDKACGVESIEEKIYG